MEIVGELVGEGDIYLSNIRTNLAYFREESQPGHPFVRAKTGFSCEVVEVCDESLENVFQTFVFTERVDSDHVLGDVVDR